MASSDRTTELTLDGRTVTITREAGALLGASVSLPSRLTRDLTITYGPMIPGLPLSSDRYGLGMTPEAQAGTTLTVVGVPAGGLELCLPVPAALASEAGARPLTLVRYEGAGWNALPGATHRATEVCAPNISSGVFSAAYTIPQLGPPSDLTATPGDTPGTILLRWTPGNDATRHWVAGIKQSDLDAGDMSSSLIWTAASGRDTHTVSGLDSGAEYVFAVAAGRGSEWSGVDGFGAGDAQLTGRQPEPSIRPVVPAPNRGGGAAFLFRWFDRWAVSGEGEMPACAGMTGEVRPSERLRQGEVCYNRRPGRPATAGRAKLLGGAAASDGTNCVNLRQPG